MLMKTTRPSAAQIVASVAKTAEHETIEKQIAELKAKREDLAVALKAIYAENRNEQNARRITTAIAETKPIEDQLRRLRHRLPELREAHGLRVAEALAPLRSEIANKLMAMIDEIEPEARALHETTVLIESAGHVNVRHRIAMPWWDQLRTQLSTLIVDK